VVGDVRALPFSDAAFDVVTAGFVLSHVAEVEVAVREAHRVLRGGGRFAVSAWEAADDEHTAFWSERLAEAITPGEAGHARAALVPSEDAMADAEGFAAALRRAGFEVAALQRPEITAELTLDEYLDDRDISAGARRGRHLLGPEGWAAFRVSVRDGMAQRFGRSLRFSRRILVTVARK